MDLTLYIHKSFMTQMMQITIQHPTCTLKNQKVCTLGDIFNNKFISFHYLRYSVNIYTYHITLIAV